MRLLCPIGATTVNFQKFSPALSGRSQPARPWIKDFHEPNAALKRPTLRQGTIG
jgi:hypothetical protein